MIKFTCTKEIFMIIHGRKNYWYQKTLCTHYFTNKRKLWKHLGCLLSIIFDEVDIQNITNQLINDIKNLNNERIIKCYNVNQSNITEEPCYISSMKPNGFINGQDESRCYVNLSFQVFFFNIYFQTVNDEYWFWTSSIESRWQWRWM